MVEYCPVYYRALFSLLPTLNIIGNVSKSTGILLLNGENDSLTPVEQAFLLQQKLTEVNHPDHTLITYPDLGHLFYPSSGWMTANGPIQQYVLADIYAWLEAHSGFTRLSNYAFYVQFLLHHLSHGYGQCSYRAEICQN